MRRHRTVAVATTTVAASFLAGGIASASPAKGRLAGAKGQLADAKGQLAG